VICSSDQQQTFLSAAMANSNICIVASSLSPFCPADVDVDADTTPERSDSAVGNCNIEETLKKLLSKHITRRKRAFTIERHNGKDTVVVARPSSKDPNSFVREVDYSEWVEKLLPDATYVNGMCMYLAAKHSKNYEKVVELYSLKVQKQVSTTSYRI
jgi:hypothetical protein